MIGQPGALALLRLFLHPITRGWAASLAAGLARGFVIGGAARPWVEQWNLTRRINLSTFRCRRGLPLAARLAAFGHFHLDLLLRPPWSAFHPCAGQVAFGSPKKRTQAWSGLRSGHGLFPTVELGRIIEHLSHRGVSGADAKDGD